MFKKSILILFVVSILFPLTLSALESKRTVGTQADGRKHLLPIHFEGANPEYKRGPDSFLIMRPGQVLENVIIDARDFKNGISFTNEKGHRTIRNVVVRNAQHNGLHILYHHTEVTVINSKFNSNKSNGILVRGGKLNIVDSETNFNGRPKFKCNDLWCNAGLLARGATAEILSHISLGNSHAGIISYGGSTFVNLKDSHLLGNGIGFLARGSSVSTIDSTLIEENNLRVTGKEHLWEAGIGIKIETTDSLVNVKNSQFRNHSYAGILHGGLNHSNKLYVNDTFFNENKYGIHSYQGYMEIDGSIFLNNQAAVRMGSFKHIKSMGKRGALGVMRNSSISSGFQLVGPVISHLFVTGTHLPYDGWHRIYGNNVLMVDWKNLKPNSHYREAHQQKKRNSIYWWLNN